MTTYIGATDVINRDQTKELLETFLRHRSPGSKRKFMPGVMMSYKTLNMIPSSWQEVFPPKETIAEIFIDHPDLMNTLHYADYEGIDVFSSLMVATWFSGSNLNALQLDMVWPSKHALALYKRKCPTVKVILQAGRIAMEQVNNDPTALCNELAKYGDSIDFVLLDRSMGRGDPMKQDMLVPHIEEVLNRLPKLGIAVAGGLGPESLELVAELAERYPMLSIDAQAKLRPSGDAHDPLDLNYAKLYLERSLTLFR